MKAIKSARKSVCCRALIAIPLLAACAGQPAATPNSQQTSEGQMCSQLLGRHDKNRDQKLSEDEYLHGVIEMFHGFDRNDDEVLDRAEMGQCDKQDAEWADVGKDGKVSFAEALKYGQKKFSERDRDHDGHLSKDEIEASLRDKSKGSASAVRQ